MTFKVQTNMTAYSGLPPVATMLEKLQTPTTRRRAGGDPTAHRVDARGSLRVGDDLGAVRGVCAVEPRRRERWGDSWIGFVNRAERESVHAGPGVRSSSLTS